MISLQNKDMSKKVEVVWGVVKGEPTYDNHKVQGVNLNDCKFTRLTLKMKNTAEVQTWSLALYLNHAIASSPLSLPQLGHYVPVEVEAGAWVGAADGVDDGPAVGIATWDVKQTKCTAHTIW